MRSIFAGRARHCLVPGLISVSVIRIKSTKRSGRMKKGYRRCQSDGYGVAMSPRRRRSDAAQCARAWELGRRTRSRTGWRRCVGDKTSCWGGLSRCERFKQLERRGWSACMLPFGAPLFLRRIESFLSSTRGEASD